MPPAGAELVQSVHSGAPCSAISELALKDLSGQVLVALVAVAVDVAAPAHGLNGVQQSIDRASQSSLGQRNVSGNLLAVVNQLLAVSTGNSVQDEVESSLSVLSFGVSASF